MYGEAREAFLRANRVWVHLVSDDPDCRVTWVGKILDAQDVGLVVEVHSVNVNGRISSYVERGTVETRFLPLRQVKYVTLAEEERS